MTFPSAAPLSPSSDLPGDLVQGDLAPAIPGRLTRHFTHAIAGLRYLDAPAAVAWLVDVLGAVAGHVYPGAAAGTIDHAELWFGDACVMLGSVRDDGLPPRPGQGSTYLVARGPNDVDAVHARAVAAGAPLLRPLHDTPYGSRDFTCTDPEGNAWSVGTYAPGAPAPA